MPSLKVICPKCLKGQQIVVEVPPGGLDHVCVLCKASFKVRPPAKPSSEDLPAPREAVPRSTDLPAPRDAVPRPTDLPAPREAVPRPTDLPAPREAVPHPGDLPVAREAIPRPGDLPVAREAIPRPGDLPVAREAIPRPGDLPIDRDVVPRPGDLPIDRNVSPRPGDLPIDRNVMPRPGDLPVDRNTVPRPAAPPPLVFSMPPPPPPRADRPPTKTPPLGLSLDLSIPSTPESAPAGESLTLGEPPAPSPGLAPLNLGLPPPPPAAPAKAPPPLPRSQPRAATKSVEAKSPTPPPPTLPVGAQETLSSLLALGGPAPAPSSEGRSSPASQRPFLAPLVPQPATSLAGEAAAEPALIGLGAPGTAGGSPPAGRSKPNIDLGFSLEFEGSSPTAAGASATAIPFPSARVASEGMAEAAAEPASDVPPLAPLSARSPGSARPVRSMARKARLPRWALIAGGAAIPVAAGVIVTLSMLGAAPNADNVLKPFLPELAKDNLAAYRKAQQEINRIAGNYSKDDGVVLRLKAAELSLIATCAHGGAAGDMSTMEQVAASASSREKLAPLATRVRALIAIAKGKPAEAAKLLEAQKTPEGQLITGLALLAQDKLPAAVAPIRGYLAARPNDLLGHYLLGRALAKGPEARKELELVVAKNPAHGGARVALVMLEETPQARLAAALALAEQKLAGAGPSELAALQLTIGRSEQALGHMPEATSAFSKAVALDKHLTPAYLALGEALLFDGKYGDALERLRAAGASLEASPAGKFAVGGALIGTGDLGKGMALVTAAIAERPDDPRGPFWTGLAALSGETPDPAAAEQGYREAIKKDPKFLLASLKLAALLQQQDRAQESLAVLRAAEEAGAPPSMLQLAWGDALIVAKEPAKAQEVFEKALEADPKSVGARLGVASALEAQDKLEEAKVALERTLKEFPESLGLHERLGKILLKQGKQSEALAQFQAEIHAGYASIPLRLAVARLALDLDKIELTQSEAKKVLDQSPRNAEAAFYMARVLELRGSTGLALNEYRHATTWGDTPLFSLHHGLLLDKLGKQQEALTSLANAVALPEGRMARGRIYFRSGDVDSALEDFLAASKMRPKDPEPLILAGHCYDKRGQAAKADEAWRTALRVDPDAAEPHYRLGRTEMDRAKPTAAIDHFRKAMAKAPEDAPWRADLTFQLAQAELLTGAKSAALANFQKYLQIAPPDAPARPEAAQQVASLSGGKGVTTKLTNSSGGR